MILGAGRVATHLAPAIVREGHELLQVWSRSETSARQVAEPLGVAYTADIDSIIDDAEGKLATIVETIKEENMVIDVSLSHLESYAIATATVVVK